MHESLQILFLEDDAGIEKTVKNLLKDEGIQIDLYRVTTRDDFESALSQENYDFIFIDWDLKETDGFDAISIVRNSNLIIPVIILSDILDETLIVEALHAGANDYVLKKNLSRLGPVVNNALYIVNKYKDQNMIETILHRKQKLRRQVAQRSQELEDANSYFQAVLDNLVDGIISIDTRGRIKNINTATTKIFGYNEKELIGQNINILMPEPYHAEHDGYLENYLNTGKANILNTGRQVAGKRKNGEVFPLELSVIETNSHGVHYFTGLLRDISERVALQTDLKNSQARFERGQEFANIGTWDWDIQSGDLYWSDRIAPLFGYPKGELETTYDNFLQAVHPDDQQYVIDAVNTCIENGTEYNIEHRCVWPDGTIRWLHEKGDVVRDDDGTPLNMLGVVQDITDRKLTEEALAENTTLLKEAQHIGKIGNWTLDVATNDLQWSDEIYRIIGYKPGDFTPSFERFFAVIHPDDVDKIKHSEKEAFDHNKSNSIDYRIVIRGSEIRWVHGETYRTCDDNNKTIKLSGTVQEITERKFNEQKLTLTNDILEQVASGDNIEQILDHVINGTEKLLPDTICAISSLGEDNKLHNRAHNRLPDFFNLAIDNLDIGEGQGACGTAAFRNNRVIVEDIFTHPYCKNFIDVAKQAKIAACWSQPIRSLTKKPFGIFSVYHEKSRSPDFNELDIIYTASHLISIALLREQNETSLKKARDEAIKASQAKSEFLSHMSHELRTPLNAIIGFSQLLELEEKLDVSQAEAVQEIHNAGNHLLDLINDILDLSLIETGNIEIEIQEVAICSLLDECVNLVETLYTNKKVSLVKEFHCSLENNTILADPKRLKQSILNLLSNAIKYNKENGQVIVSCINNDKDSVQIKIEDTGRGISKKNLKNLFTPFNRLDVDDAEIEGTGIGLVITKEFVELMGGSIHVVSEKGIGSTFSLTFNIVHSDATSHDNIDQQSDQNMNTVSAPDKTIVYIEDNPVNLKVVTKAIARLPGINLLSAMEPEEGIKIINEHKPDLILLDINLPVMNGFEVFKILKENPDTAEIPVVALSASAMASDMEKARQAGFSDYVTKPINLAVFYNMLDNHLN